MATTEPAITAVVLAWPCCQHCLEETGCITPHPEPCLELVEYPGGPDPTPQPCQGGRYG